MFKISYAEKLRDPRWQKKRLEIMQRDRFRCRDCSRSDRNLQVHHCAYSGNPWEAPNDLLLTLCDECHEKRQAAENAAKLALACIFAESSPRSLALFTEMLQARAHHSPEASVEWLDERRWIEYAIEYPSHRIFVEMVLGRVIDWKTEAVHA